MPTEELRDQLLESVRTELARTEQATRTPSDAVVTVRGPLIISGSGKPAESEIASTHTLRPVFPLP